MKKLALRFKKIIFIICFSVLAQISNSSLATESGHIAPTKIVTQDYKKYCYTTYAGKYEVTLFDDGSKKALYKLYSLSGDLQKTMQGTWLIRDEGVYGPAYMLTLTWTGLNSNMPALKFVCQYDGGGRLQGIIDGQSRVWDRCY
jgi:hypothetical protein